MRIRPPALGVLFLLSAVAFVVPRSSFAGPASGQATASRAEGDAVLLATFSPAEIQKFRDQLNAIMGDLLQIQTLNGHAAESGQANAVVSHAARLKDVEIARWLATGADLTPLQQAVENALTKTTAAQLHTRNGAVLPATTAGFPTASYGSICSGYTSDSDVVFGYQTALNTAKLVWVPLKDACDEVLVAVGEGGNTSLLCIIPDEVLQAADLILAEYTICDGDTQGAQVAANYDRLAYINEQIDGDYNATISNANANASSIIGVMNTDAGNIISNDNTNKNAIVANDNANKNAVIANDNANTAAILTLIQQNQGQLIKTFIETNLASSEASIGTFELPLSKGGQLETARDVVTALITSMQTSGLGVGMAPTYLSQGNAYLSSGQYKLAYARYRSAYQNATNAGY